MSKTTLLTRWRDITANIMKSLSVVGARPQFVKLATVSRAMRNWSQQHGSEIEDIIIHTGQHYDPEMSTVFFNELQIPEPKINLSIGSGTHGAQTAAMLSGIESRIVSDRPDVVIVYGDTNSTVAGALAAAKLLVPVVHVEAGLRSFNRAMPEETNRIVTDHVSDLLFAPTKTAVENLANEGLTHRTHCVGDVMLDAILFNKSLGSESSTAMSKNPASLDKYGIVTLHRAGNTDSDRLGQLLNSINDAANLIPLIFPVHPRTVAAIRQKYDSWKPHRNLKMIDPIGYLDFMRLVTDAKIVLTDSGGLQKEAYFLGIPCITMRDETEWPETLADGANVVAGSESATILAALEVGLSRSDDWKRTACNNAIAEFGNGEAANRIVATTMNWLIQNEGKHD